MTSLRISNAIHGVQLILEPPSSEISGILNCQNAPRDWQEMTEIKNPALGRAWLM